MSYQSHKETCAVCDGISWYFYWKGIGFDFKYLTQGLECGFQYELLGVRIKFHIEVQQKFMMLETSGLNHI